MTHLSLGVDGVGSGAGRSERLGLEGSFTCHAHEILNDLQKDQVLLIEKDPDGSSEAWRLGDWAT